MTTDGGRQMYWAFEADKPVYKMAEENRLKGSGQPRTGVMVQAFLWSRTIICIECTGLVPLAPNWKLSPELGIRLLPQGNGTMHYEVVRRAEMSPPTVKKGMADCPFCGTVSPTGFISKEADAGRLGQICYTYVCRDWYPIYRNGKSPRQGRTPCYYVVPDIARFESDRLRHETLRAAHVSDRFAETDPLYLDLGLFGGKPSRFAPGLERLYRERGVCPYCLDGEGGLKRGSKKARHCEECDLLYHADCPCWHFAVADKDVA